MIIDDLDYGTSIALSQTNRLFHAIVAPEKCTKSNKDLFLFKAELFRSNQQRSMLGCYHCHRILPHTEFYEIDNRPTLHRPAPLDYITIVRPRDCVNCQIEKGHWKRGIGEGVMNRLLWLLSKFRIRKTLSIL